MLRLYGRGLGRLRGFGASAGRTPCRTRAECRRLLSSTAVQRAPSLVLLAKIVVGLPIALWTWKCASLVVFQRRVIWMGYWPPGCRSETLDDYASELAGLHAEVVTVPSEGRVRLRGILLRRQSARAPAGRAVVLVYMQGNASTPLARIPSFRRLLFAASERGLDLHLLAVAPRSYWSSSRRRPTQSGVTTDYLAVVAWARERFGESSYIFVHGHVRAHNPAALIAQSIGASMAVQVISRLERPVDGLVLECAFPSADSMLRAIYPHRLIPYRCGHLG